MIRKFLFQLHLWSGLILGFVFVLIGLSGSVLILPRAFPSQRPTVQVTDARVLALDKGLAAARASVGAPQGASAFITLPSRPHEPVTIGFDDQTPVVLTDPGTGRVLATYRVDNPAWFDNLVRFHAFLLMPNARVGELVEGWLGVVMVFLGLTGLYLWWPKAGQWKYGFIVRRKATGLRFHRELHGAAGIWTLVLYLVVAITGVSFEFPEARQSVTAFLAGDSVPPPFRGSPAVTASADGRLIGPDAALATSRKASKRPIAFLEMPDWKPGQPTPAIMAGTGSNLVYLNPYRGTIIPGPQPFPSEGYKNIWSMTISLHEAEGLGPVYTVLVFISGLMPLIFFVTGLIMWLKKRQNRLAISRPLPESILEQ